MSVRTLRLRSGARRVNNTRDRDRQQQEQSPVHFANPRPDPKDCSAISGPSRRPARHIISPPTVSEGEALAKSSLFIWGVAWRARKSRPPCSGPVADQLFPVQSGRSRLCRPQPRAAEPIVVVLQPAIPILAVVSELGAPGSVPIAARAKAACAEKPVVAPRRSAA